jgi:hypothetical protein
VGRATIAALPHIDQCPQEDHRKWCSIITHHAVSAKAAQLRPAPSSHRAAAPDVTIHGVEEGAKADKKRHK